MSGTVITATNWRRIEKNTVVSAVRRRAL